jgi:hypothetical protein
MADPPPTPEPVGPWVELRIHGVSGTPPEVMLDSAHVTQVAGNSWGRFFRPQDGVGREVQVDPERTLEGYHWGKYTSGSWINGLWLILIPFGLVNAAAFMVPRPPGKRWHRLYVSVQGLIRGIGVGLTCTFALAAGLIMVDLVGWQWAAGLPWLRGKPTGHWLALGVVLAGAAIYALHFLGDRNRTSDFDPAPAGSLAHDATEPTGMLRSEFFHVDSASTPILGRLHLSAGWCVVALIGALTWQTIDNHDPSLTRSTSQHLVWLSSLILLGLVTVLVSVMGDPDCALEAGPPGFLDPALPTVALVVEVLSGIALVGSASVLWGTDQPRIVRLDFDAYSQWLATSAGLALLLLAILLAILAGATPVAGDVPPSFRRYARGMAAWGATCTGVFLGVGFCAAFVLGLAHALGARAQTELIYRVAYSWGITVVLVLVVGLVTGAAMFRTAGRLAPLPTHEYQAVEADHLGAPPVGWTASPSKPRRRPGTIAWAMSRARLKLHVAAMILVYAVAGLAMTAVTSIEMLGESNTPLARDWYQHLGWFGRLSERVPPSGTAAGWVQLLTNTGTYTLIALAGLLFTLGRRSLRAANTRRGANVVWDVLSFWPHAGHPFVPPAYSQFAIHDLRRRIAFHLEPGPGRTRARTVVLSAHSQGSLIAFATVLWLSEAQRQRVRLVSYGSQLQVAYPRGFPSFVSLDLIAEVLTALQGRWINLYRETDPIAGPVLSWDRSRMADTPPAPSPPTSHRLAWDAVHHRYAPDGPRADTFDSGTGRRVSGADWRVLDPPPVDAQLQHSRLTALSQHSGYPASADYRDAVASVLALP